MVFPREHLNHRFAVLVPGTGVAFSRDDGHNWIPIDITTRGIPLQPIPTFFQPRGAFYDDQPQPRTGHTSLYVSLRDSGIVRIDAPFASLGMARARCQICGGPPDSHFELVNEVTNVRMPLHRDASGQYEVSEAFDASRVSGLRYRIESGTRLVQRFEHALTSAERESGTVRLGESAAPR
jgi:hypothetical protein